MSQSWCLRMVMAGLVLGLDAVVALPAGRQGPNAQLRVRVPDAAGMAVKRALLAARERLGGAPCRDLLAAFPSDGPERPLSERLQQLGRTLEQQLDALTFEDGSRRGRCASPGILAYTHPGSETVYVCASQFKDAVRSDPTYAEMILIHELLHTLGLGENPPTSLAITARVTEHCGDDSRRRAASSRLLARERSSDVDSPRDAARGRLLERSGH
jgi:hypothetical protein